MAVERCTPRRSTPDHAHANSNLRAEMQGRAEQRGLGEYVQRAEGMVKAMLSRSIDVDACQCGHCKHPGLRKSFIRPLLSKLRYSVLALRSSNLARVLEDCSSLLLMMERREEIGRHTHTHKQTTCPTIRPIALEIWWNKWLQDDNRQHATPETDSGFVSQTRRPEQVIPFYNVQVGDLATQ